MMTKYKGTHKKNGTLFIIERHEDGTWTRIDVEGNRKNISESTIKRWYTLEEIELEKPKKEKKKRTDKYRPKLNEQKVREIRQKFNEGAKKAHLSREYGVSFRVIKRIVEYELWKHVS